MSNETKQEYTTTRGPYTQTKDNQQCFDLSERFKKLNIYIVPVGIGKARCQIFQKGLEKLGGKVHEKLTELVSHVIVDEKIDYERLLKILKLDKLPDEQVIVKSQWLSQCLKQKDVVTFSSYQVCAPRTKPDVSEDADAGPSAKRRRLDVALRSVSPAGIVGHQSSDSDYVDSGDEKESGEVREDRNEKDISELKSKLEKRNVKKGSWVCAHSSNNSRVNHNEQITEKLQALAKVYESRNDKWRALGYTKAVAAIRRHHKPITSYEEAVNIPGVGSKLATKVWEIMESGELRKLTELSSGEEQQALELFTNIWGVGASTARAWVHIGYRTLADVDEKANLNRNQKIGLRYYDEFNDRMTHEEAGEIEQVVKEAVHHLDPGLMAHACGSYRRGKSTCGDVDVLVTHPDGKSHHGVYNKLLEHLHNTGFLTDDLVSHEENGSQQKYLGVCLLPGENKKHRRLDIIVVPYDEYACAVMYFTGSAHFNRSMRNLASRMGMSLSEHSLNIGVVRKNGEKINRGTPLPTPTEESVFEQLGLPYRPPNERNH